jgi:hypothetical protein
MNTEYSRKPIEALNWIRLDLSMHDKNSTEVKFMNVSLPKMLRSLPNAIHRLVFPPLLQIFKGQALGPGFLPQKSPKKHISS